MTVRHKCELTTNPLFPIKCQTKNVGRTYNWSNNNNNNKKTWNKSLDIFFSFITTYYSANWPLLKRSRTAVLPEFPSKYNKAIFIVDAVNVPYCWVNSIKQRKSSVTPLTVLKSPSPLVCSHVTQHIYPVSKQPEALSKYVVSCEKALTVLFKQMIHYIITLTWTVILFDSFITITLFMWRDVWWRSQHRQITQVFSTQYFLWQAMKYLI